jgi:hypothetical protein
MLLHASTTDSAINNIAIPIRPISFGFIPSLDSPSPSDHIIGLKTLSLSLQLLTLYRNIPEFSFKKEGPKLCIELGPFF